MGFSVASLWVIPGVMVLPVIGAYLPLPTWMHLPVALVIAAAKAVLIILYFMHVRYSNRLTWVFSSAAFLWLTIMLVFCLADYFSRDWLQIEGK